MSATRRTAIAHRALGGARVGLSSARVALGLLTVVPVRARSDTDGIGAAAAWFPLVGALIGLAAGAVRLVADHPLGSTVAAVLAVIVLVALTGALHQDGLADVADAFGVRGDRARRLEVMRGSTVGAFGALALILWALLLVAALAALPRQQAIETLVIAAALGRWAAVLHASVLPAARPDGLGAAFQPRYAAALVATAFAVATVALEPVPALAGLVTAIVMAALTGAVAVRLVGGCTGDTLGATVALTEVFVCVVLLAIAR